MRFSFRWLLQYLDTTLPLPRVLDALYQCGLEVESVLDLGMQSGKLVTGEILKIDAIDGADKIRLCTVKADEEQPLTIVCGAQNIEVGQKVPVARFGMKFPDGFELKPRKIMGIDGQGMLCSPKELGLTEDSDGIWLLDPDVPVGQPYDAAIEISITPNRPDALSILGVARDLSAKLAQVDKKHKQALKLPDLSVKESDEKVDSAARVTVEARTDCPRYTARVVKGVKVGPSPRWMQVILETAGLRPINNIVDITNFVLLELGHPLHAFDLNKLEGRQIVVRNARAGEKIATLDGKEHDLVPEDLLICDAEKPVALAGIMGAGNSEIDNNTTDILIESAYFRPQTIRRTSRRIDKSTDASYRFERGTDPKGLSAAVNRCAQLVAKYAGGTICRGVIDVVGKIPEREHVMLRIPRLNMTLGLNLTGREIADVLTPLGFDIHRSDREEMYIEVPSFRVDVTMEADIIEEVARIVGYDRIVERPLELPATVHPPRPINRVRDLLSDAAVDLGFCQAVNYSFVNVTENELMLAGAAKDNREVQVLNPIHADMSVMRRGSLPSLLKNIRHNLNQSVDDIMLFETGSTYEFAGDEPAEADRMAVPTIETPYFAAVLCGSGKRHWRAAITHDFFEVKGMVQYFLNALGLQKLVVEEAGDVAWLHPGRSARFLTKGQPVALFGEVHPSVLQKADIKKPVFFLEIPLQGAALESGKSVYTELPKYPAITRDIALVMDKTARSMDLERTIKKAGKELLSAVKLFDVYEGEHVTEGKKSLAYSLTYRAADRTLKEEEVNERNAEIVAALEQQHGATLRG